MGFEQIKKIKKFLILIFGNVLLNFTPKEKNQPIVTVIHWLCLTRKICKLNVQLNVPSSSPSGRLKLSWLVFGSIRDIQLFLVFRLRFIINLSDSVQIVSQMPKKHTAERSLVGTFVAI